VLVKIFENWLAFDKDSGKIVVPFFPDIK